jgi:hypothetical protein
VQRVCSAAPSSLPSDGIALEACTGNGKAVKRLAEIHTAIAVQNSELLRKRRLARSLLLPNATPRKKRIAKLRVVCAP